MRAPYDNEPISLRDYLAAHAPMPNAAEAATILGWRCMESVPRPLPWDMTTEETQAYVKLPKFDDLWKGLTNSERALCCATFQYLYADHMLFARVPKHQPTRPVEQPEPDLEEHCDE